MRRVISMMQCLPTKTLVAVVVVCFVVMASAIAQKAQNTTRDLTTKVSVDSGRIDIVATVIDSFPEVSLVVRAERNSGEPLWNLKSEQVKIIEDGQFCAITSITPVTERMSFDIAMVLDHSSSMTDDIAYYYGMRYRIRNYAPITRAKDAIRKFADAFTDHDRLALVGFSSTVDVVTPLTTNHDSLKSIVSGIYADGITAFYDAVDRAIDIASSGGGIRVVVALTDGNDNNSSQSLNAVITKAKQLRIPIYVVGLGDVDKNPLKRLAQQTNGQYFYARNAKELTKVYDVIRQRLQSYYTISYETQNYDPSIVGRSISLMYEGDSVAVSPARATFSLPPNVVEYLKTRRRNLLMLSGGLVVILIGTSVVIYRRRKKRQNDETVSV